MSKMYRVTLFILAAICCISTVFGKNFFDDFNDDGLSFFNNPVSNRISAAAGVTAGLGAATIAVIVLASLCPFALILCCCCCACCPCYYCCRPRSNVTVVSAGGGGGPVQNNFSVNVPSPQPVMQQQYTSMPQQYAPMPQPETVISQHPPPQYSQEQYNHPQASAK